MISATPATLWIPAFAGMTIGGAGLTSAGAVAFRHS